MMTTAEAIVYILFAWLAFAFLAGRKYVGIWKNPQTGALVQLSLGAVVYGHLNDFKSAPRRVVFEPISSTLIDGGFNLTGKIARGELLRVG